MVVERDDCGRARNERLAKDVAWFDDGGVERPGCDDRRLQDSMPGVEKHDAELLDRTRAVNRHQVRRGVSRGPELNTGAWRGRKCSAPELERGENLGGLRGPDAADVREFF